MILDCHRLLLNGDQALAPRRDTIEEMARPEQPQPVSSRTYSRKSRPTHRPLYASTVGDSAFLPASAYGRSPRAFSC